MANKPSTREKVKELTDKLAEGVKDIFSSDNYKDYLRTMSRFHSYSTRNTVLIHMQRPDATHVAGFRTWQTKFGRNVKKGEKGIRILAPTPFNVKKEMQKIDPSTQRPVLDDAGLPEVEEVEIQIPRFSVATVFDASQTEGKPLPTLAADIFGNVQNFDLLMDAIQSISPLPIKIIPMVETTDGVCIYGKAINLREGMSQVQTVCAAVHEVTHANLHDADMQHDDSETTVKRKSKTTKEVEAESVAYAVCQYFGIETSPNSFGYLASWSSSMELKELNASLDTIRKTSASLIEDIEKQYRALAKERGVDLDDEIAAEPVEPVSEYNVAAAKLAFDGLAPGAIVYLEEAKKPVEVVAVRETDVLFSIKDMGITLTRTHAEVLQSLESRQENRPLLEAADAGVALDEIAPLPKSETSANEPGAAENIVQMHSAIISSYEGMDAFVGADDKVYIGKADNYDNKGNYDNSDNSLMYVSDNTGIFHLLSAGKGIVVSQAEAVQRGIYSEEILSEFAALQSGPLSRFTRTQDFMFDGKPFVPSGEQAAAPKPAEPSPAMATDTILPDTTITLTARDEYGYTGTDMLPLNKEKTLELFEDEQVVYLLSPDNTEEMVFERSEIEAHDGIFGIDAAEWMQTAEYSRLASATKEPAKEAELLYGEGDTFAIYQLKGGEDLHYHRWANYDELLRDGMSVDRANYDLVYTAPLEDGKTIQDIAFEFNENHPADFTGHSLSTSDVVVIKHGDTVTSYYDDGSSFMHLPSFLGDEQEPPTNSQNGNTLAGPAVAEFDEAVKRGGVISLHGLAQAIKRDHAASDAKKPSILAQLQAHQQAAPAAEDTTLKRGTEREVTV